MPDFPATDPLFLSTLSLRRATPRPSPSCHPVWDFYPRSPCGERPGTIGAAAGTAAISIHALLAESDNKRCKAQMCNLLFLSTLSLRRATIYGFCEGVSFLNFYPRSPCGERRGRHINKARCQYFYPRSPCGERLGLTYDGLIASAFLSTLSLRRATL